MYKEADKVKHYSDYKDIIKEINDFLEKKIITIYDIINVVYEDNIFDDFDLGQDNERNEKVVEYISQQNYE